MKLSIYGKGGEFEGEVDYDFVSLFGEKVLTIKFKDTDIKGCITLTKEEISRIRDNYPTIDEEKKLNEANKPIGQYKKLREANKKQIQELYSKFLKWNESESKPHQQIWHQIYTQFRNREGMFKGHDYNFTERKLKLGTTQFLKKKLGEHNRDGLSHIFISLNHYKQGYSNEVDWHNELLHPYMADGLVDIDAENIEDAVVECKKAVKFAQKKGLGFRLDFTGKKGFHLLIPHKMMVKFYGLKDQDTRANTYTLDEVDDARKNLMEDFKAHGIDVDTSTSGRQQMKRCPFTVHPATGLFCTTIQVSDLDNFNPEDYTIEKTKERFS